MNIAFLHKRYDCAGGTEKDLHELVGQLLQFGHEVHLYCGQFRVQPPAGAVAHRVPCLRTGAIARLLSFASSAPKAAAVGKHDLVISFSKVFKQDIVRCGGGAHRQYMDLMNQAHGPLENAVKWPKDRAALFVEKRQFRDGNCRRVIAVSRLVKNELKQLYHVPEDKIDVIYDGVDIARFSPQNRELYRSPIRKEYGIADKDVLALFVGSGFLRKGLKFLLSAMACLKAPGLKLLVVGHDSELDRFKHQAAQMGIADSVTFSGMQKEVNRFYAAADFLVLPSIQEAFGNVALEALASGLPVIITRNAGASEILEGDLRDFILSRPEDIDALARMMHRLMDTRLRARLSSTARRVAEQYTFETNARAVERLCERLLCEKAGAKSE
jgi:UDP-glucose:(heptosyl)LPS alpha-1,3-glucosyltransferase